MESSTLPTAWGQTDSTTAPSWESTIWSTWSSWSSWSTSNYWTESSTFTAVTESTSTLESGGTVTEPCPIGELEGDQIALVCPTGFRRHPKYCNLFYQCSKPNYGQDYKVIVLSCPDGLVFDDSLVQCVPPKQTRPCNGHIASGHLYRMLKDNSIPPVSDIFKE